MWHRNELIKICLVILILLISLSVGLASHPDEAVADDIRVAGTKPGQPVSGDEYVPDQIIVKFKEGILSAAEQQLNATLGTSVIHTSPKGGFKVLRIPAGKTVTEMVNAYRNQPTVQYAEPNYIRRAIMSPNDPGYYLQWHFVQINMPAAWDLDTTAPLYGGDPAVVVAVIDTGVAYETYSPYQKAPDLASTNFDVHGWDFANNDAHPNDDHAHGTHVTGTIAQSTNNGLGVAGIAFNSTIMPIKVLDDDGNGSDAWVADGIYYAANNGAKIINLSLGGTGPSTTMENAIAYARNAGVIIIAAAGNNGNSVPFYPAAYNNYVIAVGATRYDQTRPAYSNYGSYLDIAAPGGDVTIDQNGDGQPDGVLQQTFASGNPTSFGYYLAEGTSMASPHVAGVAALVLAKHPTWTAAQVRHALESTATDIGAAGRDDYYGWGLLNASAAINASTGFASYSDSEHLTPADDYSGSQHTVYMYSGSGYLNNHSYRVAYYDGVNSKVFSEDVASIGAALSSQRTFGGTETAGTWHVVVCEPEFIPPDEYNAAWSYTIASDTFTVQESAIPEFPTIMAAVAVAAVCAGVYFWMRRRAAYQTA